MSNVGVDGCKGGWLACWRAGDLLEFKVFENFQLLIEAFDDQTIIAVDMPMGLPDLIEAAGRSAEVATRKHVGGKRASSVFSMPSRTAIYTMDWTEARKAALKTSVPPRSFSKQGWNLLPKVRQIDALLTADKSLTARIFETHPEAVFRCLANGTLEHYKKTPEGHQFRKALLQRFGLPVPEILPKLQGAAADDLIDAAAALVCAIRISTGLALTFPDPPEQDSYGIPIAIWA